MDPLLVRFYRQYVQQIPNLTFPPAKLLLEPDIQDQIYRHFFHGTSNSHPAYERRVLKSIISLIERAMHDPDEDVILSYPHFTYCRFSTYDPPRSRYRHPSNDYLLPATNFS